MTPLLITRLIPAALAFVGAALLVLVWQTPLPEGSVAPRIPLTGTGTEATESGPSALDQHQLTTGDGTAADLPGAWPWFRGPNLDGISPEDIPLATDWGDSGPSALWSIDVGEGYAGPAVLNGRVYLMDYDRDAQTDALRCLSLADGREIWRFSYPLKVKRNHGMSRTVPAVTDKHVVALGPKCHLSCLDSTSGEFKWGLDLVRDHGSKVPPWYAGQCPLIDGDRVIIAPAGDKLMMALDIETGETLWSTPNPRSWKMTHVSIATTEIAGRKTYVYCGHRGVAGIAADDGSLLWDTDEWKISIATVSTPLPLPDGRIFFSGGYKAGSMMLAVSKQDDAWTTEVLYRLDQDSFGATQQTPILYQDHIYGVRPNGELVCLAADGSVRWTSGANHRFGLGPFTIADDKILVMDDDGHLTIAEAKPDEFRPLADATVLDGHESWGPLTLAGGRLIARDLTRMICLDLRKK